MTPNQELRILKRYKVMKQQRIALREGDDEALTVDEAELGKKLGAEFNGASDEAIAVLKKLKLASKDNINHRNIDHNLQSVDCDPNSETWTEVKLISNCFGVC